MKRVLLTGATGLIGATVSQILSKTYEVVTLGRTDKSDIQADFSQPASLDGLNFPDCAAVVHCAGITDEDFKQNPINAFVQSTIGINALIKTAIISKVKKFIYISSSHVYGAQTGSISEDTPANPLGDYAIAHYAAEQTLRRNAINFENCYVLRPNAVFGAPLLIDKFDRWSLIPYSFPLEAVYHRKIVLRSSGEQNRNFISTKDIANYIESLLATSSGENFSVINPLGKETASVYQFALKCAETYFKLTGNQCLVERPLPKDEVSEEMFIYQTNHRFNVETSDLDEYIESFMSRILEDLQNGKKFGS